MGEVLHSCARTAPRVRAERRAARASARALARQYGLNPKTVATWRKRTTTADAPLGPRRRRTVLTEAQEALAVVFRHRTRLPLDDLLGCLREQIPALTRSALHRCLRRHGISRLPHRAGPAPKRGRFAETPLGNVHLDSCEVRSTEGKRHRFLAVDWVTKFAYVELPPSDHGRRRALPPGRASRAFPYAIRTVLTDNGTAFAAQPRYRNGPTEQLGGHPFGRTGASRPGRSRATSSIRSERRLGRRTPA